MLVHCKVGKSRSASIVITYLMNRFGLNFDSALNFVVSKRPIVNPNRGFAEQIAAYFE